MQPSPGYMHMVAQVKAHYRLQGQELDHPLRVVIAQRPGNHDQAQRVLTNAAELAASLQERGMQTQASPEPVERAVLGGPGWDATDGMIVLLCV